jgi:hypothetical protein
MELGGERMKVETSRLARPAVFTQRPQSDLVSAGAWLPSGKGHCAAIHP